MKKSIKTRLSIYDARWLKWQPVAQKMNWANHIEDDNLLGEAYSEMQLLLFSEGFVTTLGYDKDTDSKLEEYLGFNEEEC